ncbi:MAG: hypothetical protein FGM37_00540 [Phycisphaerales bacterium]|nr:hypothetical protein [Phycisphaerales bacterium]
MTGGEIQYSFVRLGRVPHDGFALPVTDPSGSFIAVQERSSADWPTLLASVDGGVPEAGAVAIHAISGATLVPKASAGPDLLLGRMCTPGSSAVGVTHPAGVLVESPRLDGSRWIGVLPWDAAGAADTSGGSGAVRWIARNSAVNAFAAAHTDGSLAWSARERGVPHFGLAVLDGPEGARVLPAPDGASLVAPFFAADGRHLYALRLGDGTLTLVAYPWPAPRGAEAFAAWKPVAELPLSWRADARTAYQSVVPLGASASTTRGHAMVFHPRFARIALWDPSSGAVSLASADSLAATDLGNDAVAVGGRRRLAVEPYPTSGDATDSRAGISVIEAPWVPRGPAILNGSGVLAFRPEAREIDCAVIELRGR